MAKKQESGKGIKALLVIIAIVVAAYILYRLSGSLEILLGALSLSIGVLAIIWTLIAKYSLSPHSTMRLFTNSFLASLIALVVLSFVRLVDFSFFVKENMMYLKRSI